MTALRRHAGGEASTLAARAKIGRKVEVFIVIKLLRVDMGIRSTNSRKMKVSESEDGE